MKAHFRQSMAWLHTWGTLTVGWVMFFVFALGTATMFHIEITRWMQPERPLSMPIKSLSREVMLEQAFGYLGEHAVNSTHWAISLPHERHRRRQERRPLLGVGWQSGQVDLDPLTGAPVSRPLVRDTEGGETFLELHSELHYFSKKIGKRLVAAAAMLGLLGLVTGVIVHKKLFKDFFTFRPGKGQRSWLDAHNITGVMALPFFVMIIYSGLVYFDRESLPVPVVAHFGTDEGAVRRYYAELLGREKKLLPVEHPKASIMHMIERAERELGEGEVGQIEITHPMGGALQVQLRRPYGSELPRYESPETIFRFDATTGERLPVAEYGPGISWRWFWLTLHDAWFATPTLLWLYVLSGLLGCVMIATGMALWVIKRREQLAREGSLGGFGLNLVARLNIGMLAGLPVGVAAYFWANRLLPPSLVDRAEWEIHCLFIAWVWVILFGALRPEKQAWVEVLSLGALAFGLIPVLNALTTDRHLGVTIPAGDWGLAGFDLSMLALGAIFAAIAWKLWRRWHGSSHTVAVVMEGA